MKQQNKQKQKQKEQNQEKTKRTPKTINTKRQTTE
jgi:hypothetical protein